MTNERRGEAKALNDSHVATRKVQLRCCSANNQYGARTTCFDAGTLQVVQCGTDPLAKRNGSLALNKSMHSSTAAIVFASTLLCACLLRIPVAGGLVPAALPHLTNLLESDALRRSHGLGPFANWVIPGVVVQGANPALIGDSLEEGMRWIRKDLGVTTFVSLQAEEPPQDGDKSIALGGITQKRLKNSKAFTDYATEAQKYEPEPRFIHFGITDMNVADSLDSLCLLVNHLHSRVENGEVLYLHCFGGKGRAGLVACCLLGSLYPSLTAKEALARMQGYASTRSNEDIKSPQTLRQLEQVRSFYALLGRKG